MQALAIRCVGGDSDACRELSARVLIDKGAEKVDDAERLTRAWQALNGVRLPEPGDVVTVVPGLEGEHSSADGVIIEVPPKRPWSSDEGGASQFGNAYDARLGYLDSDGDLTSHWVDRRLFKVSDEGDPQLRELFRLFSKRHDFKVGDIVKWKPAMRNRTMPRHDELAVVMRVEDKPLFDTTSAGGSSGFQEAHTLWLGVTDEQGQVRSYYFDAARFEPAAPETSSRVDSLKSALKRYQQAARFKPGQIVTWKAGLRNRNVPTQGVAAVVLEVIDPPIRVGKVNSGAPTFHEPLSLRVGVLDDDEDLAAYYVDGNRFEAAPDTIASEALRRSYDTYAVRHEFRPGDLVTWKRSLRNKMSPPPGGVGIVVEVLPTTRFDQHEEPHTAYFREPLDIRIGLVDADGDFTIFHFDKQRFEPYRTTVARRP